MIEKKKWNEFQKTGLLVFVNQFLHIFGWVLVLKKNEQGEIIECYPAHCKFRGFDSESNDEAYKNVSKFMDENSERLRKETEDE